KAAQQDLGLRAHATAYFQDMACVAEVDVVKDGRFKQVRLFTQPGLLVRGEAVQVGEVVEGHGCGVLQESVKYLQRLLPQRMQCGNQVLQCVWQSMWGGALRARRADNHRLFIWKQMESGVIEIQCAAPSRHPLLE